jgi:hypothetical protein
MDLYKGYRAKPCADRREVWSLESTLIDDRRGVVDVEVVGYRNLGVEVAGRCVAQGSGSDMARVVERMWKGKGRKT